MARQHEPPPSAAVVAIDPGRRRSHADPRGLAAREARTARRIALLTSLIAHRVPEPLAHALADDASRLGSGDECKALASALELRLKARPINYVNANALLLKGMSGSGKTSVAAKIAAQAALTGRKVKVLTSDPNVPGLVELASKLRVKIVPLGTTSAIARAVADAERRESLAVIDTSGFNPRRAKARAAFEALGQIDGVETIGVVSALYDAAEMAEVIEALGAQRTIVTGLDLARRAGALTVAATSGRPIAHVSRSSLAGDGLEAATPLLVARALLSLKPGWQ